MSYYQELYDFLEMNDNSVSMKLNDNNLTIYFETKPLSKITGLISEWIDQKGNLGVEYSYTKNYMTVFLQSEAYEIVDYLSDSE